MLVVLCWYAGRGMLVWRAVDWSMMRIVGSHAVPPATRDD